jgi:proline iminopeptidase
MAALQVKHELGATFRRDVRELDVPLYLVQGRHELAARNDLAREWFARLDARLKRWITFADSGHVTQFEEFERFRHVVTDNVLID